MIELAVTDSARIISNDFVTPAIIWKTIEMFTSSRADFLEHAHEILEEMVDQFSNDYLAVNPK